MTRRSGSNFRRMKIGLRLWLVLSVAALGMVLAAPALAESHSIRGEITEVSRSAEVVLVEENPSDESGSAKGEFAVDDKTEILEQQDGDLAPVAFEALRVGQMVEATYTGPVAESYPTQGIAGRIVIFDGNQIDHQDDGPAVLPNTGGVPPAALGALLIAGALLARRVARFLR